MIEIAIAVTCYGNENEIIEFAHKLSNQKESEKMVLLVTCNKCKNAEKLRSDLRKIKIHTEVFEPGKNLGYLHGCLYGLKSYDENYKWGIISNTDVDFVSNKFFETFLNKNYKSEIGCIGADIVLKVTGKHQNPFALVRPSNKIMKIRQLAYSNYGLYKLYFGLSDLKGKIQKKASPEKKGYIYGAHGSVIILRAECIKKMIADDIQIFMYGEELYIAEKLKENQFLTYYDTDLKIIHNENQVTGKVTSRIKQKWCSQSINFLVKRYWKK